jgi:glycosyltransferase involved in cell wall biosynthesis
MNVSAMTVVICNYNHGPFLSVAIDSALAQRFQPCRVLVVDDGSTDDSRQIIQSYGARIGAILKQNGGQVSAYGVALERVDSPYVMFLDADDFLYLDAVDKVMSEFRNESLVKVQFRLDVVSGDGAPTGVSIPQTVVVGDCGAQVRAGWLYPSPPGSGNAYRVSALRRIFPVPIRSTNRHGADFYAIYGIALTGKITALGESLGAYRVHSQEQIAAGGRDQVDADLSFGNSESTLVAVEKTEERWAILRDLVQANLGIALPVGCRDFALEKARFGHSVYRAPFARRWGWFTRESGRYFHVVFANPFWSPSKKVIVGFLTALCVVPLSSISDLAVRYIVNPASRRVRKS